jgi:phosphoheptose isomerase
VTGKRFVLLDRDGTINVQKDYVLDAADLELAPGTIEALRELRSLGLGLVVVTNQSPVGRGWIGEEQLEAIHDRLRALLGDGGVELDGLYVCPHRPEDGCDCRKPQPGLALRASEAHGFDPTEAFVVGDHRTDVEMGRRIGAHTILLRTARTEQGAEAFADHVAADLNDAANIIRDIVLDRGRSMSASRNAEQARAYLLETSYAARRTADACAADVSAAAQLVCEALLGGGKILLCGNGGSAADSQHLAAEFVSTLTLDNRRPAIPAIALTTDTSILTAVANDFGFEGVFARQVEALGRAGDVLIGISTSGNSADVVLAFEHAERQGLRTIALTGESGGRLAPMADVAIKIPSSVTSHIQECHIAVGQLLALMVEEALYPQD